MDKFINNAVRKDLANDTSNQDKYKKYIHYTVSSKTSNEIIKKHKQEGPDEVRHGFLKYGGEALTQTLKIVFKKIFDSEDIPYKWKISMLINIGKKKDKEKIQNKRGISSCNKISNLYQKITVNRLNRHPNCSKTQAGARPQKSTLSNLFTAKSIIQQRKHKETYVAFIDTEKAYDKI